MHEFSVVGCLEEYLAKPLKEFLEEFLEVLVNKSLAEYLEECLVEVLGQSIKKFPRFLN